MKVIIDSREQKPYEFSDSVVKKLDTGDYSLAGFEDLISIERKSLTDFLGCVGRHRNRFERELKRLRGYKCRAVIIEATLKKLTDGKFGRSKITAAQALMSIASWRARYGIDFLYVGNWKQGNDECRRILEKFYSHLLRFAEKVNGVILDGLKDE